MHKFIFFTFIFLTHLLQSQQMKPATGIIKHYENFPSKLVKPRNIDVWLPENYSKKDKYAVLYMHDGQMLFDASNTWNKQEWRADEIAGKLMAEKRTEKFIIVGISSISEIRHSDYFPEKAFEILPEAKRDSLYESHREGQSHLFGSKINSDNYLKFIVTELKPFIDNIFSTYSDQQHTFIAGSSMGGLISLYAICEYPNIFAGAACLSTHWPGVMPSANNPVPDAFMAYMKNHLPSPKNHKIYFDYGTATLDAAYEPLQLKADEVMKSKGYKTGKNWVTKKFEGADHSEKSWAERLDVPFLFLLGR